MDPAKQPYTNWLNSSEAVANLKQLILKSGFPLEIAARNILKNDGYDVSNSYYSQIENISSQEVWREIDIDAHRLIDRKNEGGCEFLFHLVITGDCKFSSTNDYFGFPNDTQITGPSFPVIYERNIVEQESLASYFIFPSVIQNMVEIDVPSSNTFPKAKDIYDGCTQIFNAFNYFVKFKQDPDSAENYRRIYKLMQPRFEKYRNQHHPELIAHDRRMYYEKSVIKHFIESSFSSSELFSIIRKFDIHIGIPILIVGPNNGVLRINLKDEELDLTDIKYCAYLFTPKELKADSKLLLRNSFNFAIIVCNVNYLHECLQCIEVGIMKSIDYIMSRIRSDPYLLYYEIYNFILAQRYQQ